MWPRSRCPLGPRGPGQSCLLRLLPQSGARAPALVVPTCLLRNQASVSPHREWVPFVLPPTRCSRPVWLSCFATVSDNKANGSFASPGQRAAPSPDMLLESAETDVSLSLRLFLQVQQRFSLMQRGRRGQEDFAPCGCITPSCGDKLRQAAAASPRPGSEFPKNAVLSQKGCPGKEAFALCGFLRSCCEH